MKFSLMFFATSTDGGNPYDLLVDATRFADANGFEAVWTPEHHFDRMGGPFPNPAITSAALATLTKNIRLRAGSVISPLHDLVRLVEDWAVVDNLSKGRVALSLGSGWNPDTFVLSPHTFATRQALVLEQVSQLRRLWSGETVRRDNGVGKPTTVEIFPRPFQKSLPLWLTSTGNPDTFKNAGTLGTNVLTHLVSQDVAELENNIAIYRKAHREAGHHSGIVTLMLHTYLASDEQEAIREVRAPLMSYLRTFFALRRAVAKSRRGGSTVSPEVPEDVTAELLEIAFERYCTGLSLIGTHAKCRDVVRRLATSGVDEIACLIDFGVEKQKVMRSLELATKLISAHGGAAFDARTRSTP